MTSPYPRAARAAWMAAGRRTTRAAAAAALALAAACSDMATDPQLEADLAKAPAVPALDEEFTAAAYPAWLVDTHPLGRGSVRAANVTLGGGAAALALAPGAYDGGEIRTAARYGPGTYEARMRTPRAPGSISAFFLYEGVSGGNDELDIEIFNDGTRRVMFTTWVGGTETNNVIRTLPFDPAAALHDYRIEWTAKSVRFRVDGVVMQELKRGIPQERHVRDGEHLVARVAHGPRAAGAADVHHRPDPRRGIARPCGPPGPHPPQNCRGERGREPRVSVRGPMSRERRVPPPRPSPANCAGEGGWDPLQRRLDGRIQPADVRLRTRGCLERPARRAAESAQADFV